MRALAALSLVGVVLLATHRGEFWPYSIYPMFSVGGRPWLRAIARDVGDVPEDQIWQPETLETLAGKPLALTTYGIPQIDFTEFVNHTERWDEGRIEGMRALFAAPLRARTLLIYHMRGDVDASGRAQTEATPILLLGPNVTELNPRLREQTARLERPR